MFEIRCENNWLNGLYSLIASNRMYMKKKKRKKEVH